jgi:hypothetical protein
MSPIRAFVMFSFLGWREPLAGAPSPPAVHPDRSPLETKQLFGESRPVAERERVEMKKVLEDAAA